MGALRASRLLAPLPFLRSRAPAAPPPGVNSRLHACGAHMEPLNLFSQERTRCATACTSRQAFGGLRSRRQVGERYRAGSYRRIRRQAGGTATCLDDRQPDTRPPIGSAGTRGFCRSRKERQPCNDHRKPSETHQARFSDAGQVSSHPGPEKRLIGPVFACGFAAR